MVIELGKENAQKSVRVSKFAVYSVQEICSSCLGEIKKGERKMAFIFNEEVEDDEETIVLASTEFSTYHKKCFIENIQSTFTG